MIVYKTTDLEIVSKILNHPRVFRMVSDDLTPDTIIPPPGIHIVDDRHLGVVRIDPLNGFCCTVLIAALPSLWGRADEFVNSVLSWGFSNTIFTKVVAMVPDYNRLTMKLCSKCGFLVEGVIRESFLKDWEYHDMTIFGLTKEQFLS